MAARELAPLRGEDKIRIRAAAETKLADLHVLDPSEIELRLIVDAVQSSPRRAAFHLGTDVMRTVLGALREAHAALKADSLPGWTSPPPGVPYAPTDALDSVNQVELTPRELVAARPILERLLRDLGDQDDPEEGEQVRPIPCWVSLNATAGTVTVHIGESRLASVLVSQAAPLPAAIATWGSPSGTLRVDADLYGSDSASARIALTVPRP